MTGATLLLVEDEPITALSSMVALEQQGYRVNLCATGFDALNFIEMEETIDALVTDVDLGQGPDGWEIARRARDHFPKAPVIYITGAATADFEEEGVPESRILAKPYHTETLVDMVSSVLN